MTKQTSILAPTHDIPEKVDPTLATILSWPRPHGSEAEGLFGKWLLEFIAATTTCTVKLMSGGCIVAQLNDSKGQPSTVLFSCHIDTVDADGCGKLLDGKLVCKSLTYDPNFGLIGLEASSTGTCLGADDGAGIWLMLEMMKAKVPGCYVFHRGEERGGIGSNAMLQSDSIFLKGYDIAVAFDRPNDSEVITHQGGQECCSQKFANRLSEELSKRGLDYAPSSRGVFTDTKVYRGVIAECTNLGVGYTGQHGKGETQDYAHLVAMLGALRDIDWESLPVDRDPTKIDQPAYKSQPAYKNHHNFKDYGRSAFAGYPGREDSDIHEFEERFRKAQKAKPKAPPPPPPPPKSASEDLRGNTLQDLVDWCETDPEAVARSIIELLLEVGRLKSDVEVMKDIAGLLEEDYAYKG